MTSKKIQKQIETFLSKTVEFYYLDSLKTKHYYKSIPNDHHEEWLDIFPRYGAACRTDWAGEKREFLKIDERGLGKAVELLEAAEYIAIPFSKIHIVASYNLPTNE